MFAMFCLFVGASAMSTNRRPGGGGPHGDGGAPGDGGRDVFIADSEKEMDIGLQDLDLDLDSDIMRIKRSPAGCNFECSYKCNSDGTNCGVKCGYNC